MANKNNAIKNYCHDDEIIVDIDSDDELVGKQVFKFLNAVYQRDDPWLAFTNFVSFNR